MGYEWKDAVEFLDERLYERAAVLQFTKLYAGVWSTYFNSFLAFQLNY